MDDEAVAGEGVGSGKSWPCTCSTSSLPPTYWVSQRGILTRPMSSPMGWWLQASAIRMRSPERSSSMASAPATCAVRSPLKRAKRMEKLVMRHVGRRVGGHLEERLRVGDHELGRRGEARDARCLSSRSLTTSAMASLSMRSRMACTCGRIRRPRGASLSIGTTSTASSPGPTRSPRIVGLSMKSAGAASSSAWRKSSTPRPSDGGGAHRRAACARAAAPRGRRRRRQVDLVEDDHGRGSCAPANSSRMHVLVLAPARRPRRPARPGRCGRRPAACAPRAARRARRRRRCRRCR